MKPDDQTRLITHALQSRIRQAGFSQKEVEQSLGMGDGYVSALLRGHVDLKVIQLAKILEIIGVGPGEFFAELARLPQFTAPREPGHRPTCTSRRVEDLADKVSSTVRQMVVEALDDCHEPHDDSTEEDPPRT